MNAHYNAHAVTSTDLIFSSTQLNSITSAPTFLGHPRGLFYLAMTEGWERFSYYGMVALLSLYMVGQLLLPGYVEHIAGLSGLRAVLESMVGPLSTQALAAQLFGLYSGLVYFTPVLGGMIADRWIGRRNAVVIGALSMSAGHAAMMFDQLFLAALLLLIIGSGFLKGNISAQVGSLYSRDDESGRTRGFTIFQTAINIGAVIGPLLCGLLAQVYGWHYGFGIAAIFMLVGLATYLSGYRYMTDAVGPLRIDGGPLTSSDRRMVAALLAVMAITIFQSVASYQVYNVMPIWAQQHVGLGVAGFTIPAPWYQSAWAVFSIVGVPPVLWWWRRQAIAGREPGDVAKIGTGAWITAASNLILVAATISSGSAPLHPMWPLLYVAGLGISFIYYWPTLLALVSRAAPVGVNATLMGVAMLTLFVANVVVGWIGGWYERLNPAEFWGVHAAIAAGGGVLIAVFRRRLAEAIHTSEERQAC
jgi:POT family proton-dependent oligopeptide transporter